MFLNTRKHTISIFVSWHKHLRIGYFTLNYQETRCFQSKQHITHSTIPPLLQLNSLTSLLKSASYCHTDVPLTSPHCYLVQYPLLVDTRHAGRADRHRILWHETFCNKAELATKPLAECRQLVKEEKDGRRLFSVEIEWEMVRSQRHIPCN